MMDFSWIIIILVIFGIISSVTKRMKNNSPSPKQRPQTSRDSRMNRSYKSSKQRPLPETAKLGDRLRDEFSRFERSLTETPMDYGDTEGDRATGESTSFQMEDGNLDEINNMIPYAKEDDKAYARENKAPYERGTVLPYQRRTTAPYQLSRKTGTNPFKHLTTEQLREGILLSEVLQSPRAKRPHPAVRRYPHPTKG